MGRYEERLRLDYRERLRGELRAVQEKRLAGGLKARNPAKAAFLSWMVDSGYILTLSHEELLFFIALYTYADARTGKCWPARARIRAQTGLGQRAYYEIRAALHGRGLLSWHRGARRKGAEREEMPVIYTLNFDPLLLHPPGGNVTVVTKVEEFVARGLTASRGRRTKPQANPERPSYQPLGGDVTGIGNSELVSVRKTPPDPPKDGGAGRVVVAAAAPALANAADAAPPPRKTRQESPREELAELKRLDQTIGLEFSLQRRMRELEEKIGGPARITAVDAREPALEAMQALVPKAKKEHD